MKSPFSDKTYSSKLILYGEYGVIDGGEILATPLSLYDGQWKTGSTAYHNKGLLDIKNYLASDKFSIHQINLNLSNIDEIIANNIYFQSNIPSGYGLGSSGAITTAIYDLCYEGPEIGDASQLQKVLATIESCFHGVSSGIDPLVIALNMGVHISNGIISTSNSINLKNYFLIDTGLKRKTKPLVDQYRAKAVYENFVEAKKEFLRLNSLAIKEQLSQDSNLSNTVAAISQWQFDYLDFAVPADYYDLWKESMSNKLYSIKLCGAGGGGFLLGYSDSVDQVMKELQGYKIIPLSTY